MSTLFQVIANQLPFDNPYNGFDYLKYQPDLGGGIAHPAFEQIIDLIKPKTIIEVGSWKGLSAVHIASLLKKKEIDGVLLCIDTWLGTVNNLLRSDDPVWGLGKYYYHGYPTLHQQFLANVMYNNLQDYILPIPTTSAIGARWLTAKGIQADMIYIDGSHEEEEVYQDITNYWKILRPNGIMIGDDWHINCAGVICAVNAFCKENTITYQVAGSSWIMQKR